MEANQTAQMVAWLDEERRKDKATIVKLEEKVGGQTALIEDQTRRIQSLEADLNAMKTRFASISFVDEAAVRLRNDLIGAIEQAEVRRSASVQDLKKMRDTDREGLQKAIDTLRQEMLARIERELQPRRAEEERLSRVAFELQNYADNLSKSFEGFEHTLNFLEEQRRQDSRRITELTELGKRIDSVDPKMSLLEELARRNERSISELGEGIADIRQERREWLEQNAVIDQQREQALVEMRRRMESFAEEIESTLRQVNNWGETHRQMKKNVDDFERLVDRVDRRVNEVLEVQRLSEERFRREWEDFLQEDQRRIRQFTLTNEEAWREHDKVIEEVRGRLASLSERAQALADYVKAIRQAYRTFVRTLAEGAESNAADFDDSITALPPLS